MITAGSVTTWLRAYRSGDDQAAQRLFERYFRRMVVVARQRIGRDRPDFDSEDVALSAFHTFCSALQENQYPELNGADGLWRLLVVMTERKAGDRMKGERALRRGGAGRNADRLPMATVGQRLSLDEIIKEDDDPQLLILMAEEYRRLLDILQDAELEQLAIYKMEGYTNEEVAERLGYSRRTVQRMLNLIKKLWTFEVQESGEPATVTE